MVSRLTDWDCVKGQYIRDQTSVSPTPSSSLYPHLRYPPLPVSNPYISIHVRLYTYVIQPSVNNFITEFLMVD